MKAIIFFLPFLLTACGLNASQWTNFATEAALREAPLLYSRMQEAKTSAKNPKAINP